MCQTRNGKSRLKTTSKCETIKVRTSKYLKIGSTVIAAVEPFPYIWECCCQINQYRSEWEVL